MMKNLLLFATVFLSLTSCTHYYYMPNTVQIPNLHQRHDAVLSAAACNMNGWEAQALYSPVNHGYLLFNHMKIPSNSKNGDINSGNGSLTEYGAGTYWSDGLWCLSLSGGFGKGRVKNTYETDSLTGVDFFSLGWVHDTFQSSVRFRRWFVQPALSFEGKWVFAGAALRFLWLDNYSTSEDPGLSGKLPKESYAIQRFSEDSPLQFAEFGLSVGLKVRPFRLSYNITNLGLEKSKVERLHFLRKNQSLKLSLNIHELWRKKGKS